MSLGYQHPINLSQHLMRVLGVLKHMWQDHQIKRFGAKRQGFWTSKYSNGTSNATETHPLLYPAPVKQ
ncbi:hypothetical protein BJI67_09960 [Acidihalobacter aeolianus]|uniref:Uncharacterized protein n=1 Tax=Acidihalobacter aeolianus TaxID=2792603 RepID=A0A1D8K8P8_9GAMM|nr:hypothetical protein BJI67_09960 [Acidihalobacter aeolianus]